MVSIVLKMFIPYEYFWQYCHKNEKAISLVCIHNFVSFMKSWNLIIFCQITQALAQSPFNFFDMVFISIRLKRKMRRRLFHALTDNFLSSIPLIISYHQFRFLIGSYSVVEIWYFIKKKEKKIIKTQLFWWNTTKKCQTSICKH